MSDRAAGRVGDIETRARAFAEWLSVPVGLGSQDSRFEIRRATPVDHDRIFDLVDMVFERPRGRAAYEWLYHGNPLGTARCWLVIERSSGELVASESRFPWPIARGAERIEGEFCGDYATLPRVQRQGIFRLRSAVRDSHPWRGSTISLSVPNVKSRGALAKRGDAHMVMGPLPLRSILLDCASYLRSRSYPPGAASKLGRVANAALDLWHDRILAAPSSIRIEEIRHFDSGVDAVTHRSMSTPAYWCPHEADFLNWRYFRHPSRSYLAQAALVDDEVVGYSVFGVEDERAVLMEFAAAPAPEPAASALLRATFHAVREAGCHSLRFHATTSWRFWGLFRRAGFFERESDVYLSARCPDRPDASREENWQLLPGDSDVL